jgi:hypothetical protein
MATQTGLTHLFGFGTLTFLVKTIDASTTVTNYAKPNIQGMGFTHSLDSSVIKSTNGEVTGLILHGEMIECTFDFIPEGTAIAITNAAGNANASAFFPPVGGSVQVTGMPVIVAGSFNDALNTGSSGTNLWIYKGGGTIKGENASNWTGSIPLVRYPGITSAVPVAV